MKTFKRRPKLGNSPPERRYAWMHSRNVLISQSEFGIIMWISAPRPPLIGGECYFNDRSILDIKHVIHKLTWILGKFSGSTRVLDKIVSRLSVKKRLGKWVRSTGVMRSFLLSQCIIFTVKFWRTEEYRGANWIKKNILFYFFRFGLVCFWFVLLLLFLIVCFCFLFVLFLFFHTNDLT